MGFKKWVNEMAPVKISGNAPFESLEGESKSLSAMEDDYYEIGTINESTVFKHNDFDLIKIARKYDDDVKNEERWAIIAELSFKSTVIKSDNKLINGKKAIKIATINVRESNRRDGFAHKLYNLIMTKGYIIISDGVQYENAVKLWKSFTKINGIKVLIWDEMKDVIISKMTAKTHDNAIWSNGDLGDYSKMSTKLILTIE